MLPTSSGMMDGSWLKSPSMTADESPSLPARWTQRTGYFAARLSTSLPVPSGELSSTMTTSPRMPAVAKTFVTAAMSFSIPPASLYAGLTTETSYRFATWFLVLSHGAVDLPRQKCRDRCGSSRAARLIAQRATHRRRHLVSRCDVPTWRTCDSASHDGDARREWRRHRTLAVQT